MTEKKYDVTALGELLIDFIGAGDSEFGNPLYEANPGGAPCNVLAMLQKLGRKTAFIGKVGNDGFGRQLKDAVDSCGVDLSGLVMDDEVHTTLAFVHKLPNGDRDFSFYRGPGADMMLTAEEVNEDLIKNAKVFHFGSLGLTDEPVRSATHKALQIAGDAPPEAFSDIEGYGHQSEKEVQVAGRPLVQAVETVDEQDDRQQFPAFHNELRERLQRERQRILQLAFHQDRHGFDV